MPWLLTLRRRRGALQTLVAFSLVLLLACSGDDANGPTPDLPNDPPGGPVPTQPTPDQPPPAQPPPDQPPPDQPPPDQPPPPDEAPVGDLVGAYVLTRINEGFPGQLITVANPDGNVVGLYRFAEGTMLGMTPDQTWSLSLKYTDDKVNFILDDEGDFGFADDGAVQFRSAVFGDEFRGTGGDGALVIGYDLDGNGETDLILGFARILPPGS